MSTSFLKDQIEKKEKEQDRHESNKNEFRDKILFLLGQIKELNEERYQELNRMFHQGYDSVNVQKKKLLGLHGQLLGELKGLREKAGITVTAADQFATTTKKVAHEMAHQMKKEVQHAKKQVAQQANHVKKELQKGVHKVEKAAEEAKKKAQAAVKKVAAKSKPAAKKAAPKAAAKPAAKKAVKKAAPAKKKTAKRK